MTRVWSTAEVVVTVAVSSCLLTVAVCPAAVAEETLGRLFFSPERRQQLDRQRELNVLDQQQVLVDPTLTIDGVVTRSSGRRTAWVNGSPQNEDEQWTGLAVTPRHGDPGRVMIETNDLPAARARVGQTVNRNTGASTGLLNGGQLQVHSGRQVSR